LKTETNQEIRMSQALAAIKSDLAALHAKVAALEAQARSIAIAAVTIAMVDGERFAGLVLDDDGLPSHYLVLLPGAAEGVTWSLAGEWAAKAGGELPTRREQSLLFANLKSEFESNYYWSSEQHAANSDYAWLQHFGGGYQDDNHKSYEGRARAVRRLPI
jgi:hypothetical protein